ncbi:MAG: alcohol dehydrogenase catalytic domain-containing protein [candidate division NC10 bacterium]|nr:alcohol dehydrogenase catalytic domain-containing protein [candidate division NC10 bacterium]
MMRAAVYQGNRQIRLEELPIPRTGPGELLVRVTGCGICATDVSKVDHALVNPPAVLGHEVAGTVALLGDGVQGLTIGQRVVVSHHVPCYACHYCKHGNFSMCRTFKTSNIDPGGFAEYMRVPALNVQYATYPIPPHLEDEEASFTEPLACCLRGVKRLCPLIHDTVLLFGLGSIGLMLLQVLKLHQVRVICLDPLSERLEGAKVLGADLTLNPGQPELSQAVRDVTEGRGADAAILTAGGPQVFTRAIDLLRDGGVLLPFASDPSSPRVDLDIHQFFHRELSIVTSYSPSTIELQEALALLADRTVRVKDLVTHRVPLAELERGMHLFRNKEALKVFVEMEKA